MKNIFGFSSSHKIWNSSLVPLFFSKVSSDNKKNDSSDKFQKLIESYQKRRLTVSNHTKTAMKSLSGMFLRFVLHKWLSFFWIDTILLRKKIIPTADRLKRLTVSKSFFKRQTTSVTKKASNIKNKILDPLAKIKNKFDTKFVNNIQPSKNFISDHDTDESISNGTSFFKRIHERTSN